MVPGAGGYLGPCARMVPTDDGEEAVAMPLSEDEQRILQEIEAQLYQSDPELAQQVSKTTLYRHAARAIKWSALGFVLGFALLILTVASNTFIALGGFAVMLVCLIIIAGNVRKLGKAGLESLTASMRSRGVGSALGNAGKRWRQRWRRDDS